MNLLEKEINAENLKLLDAYTASFSPCEVLQSSKWFHFKKLLNQEAKLFYWQTETDEGWFMAYRAALPFAYSYFYIPRGPVLANPNIWKKLLELLATQFKKDQKVLFIRFEPDLSFKDFTLAKATETVQPRQTLHTTLTTAEKMLEGMHQKTRYNIKLGLKKKLEFKANDADIDSFWKLMEETARRDKFKPHAKSYYEKMISSGVAQLGTVRYDGNLLAAGIFFSFDNTLTYAHGASSSTHRSMMAPYVLHWEMMCWGVQYDFKIYDWHGIDEKKWPGFTRFKKGFGGNEIMYPGTFDYPLATSAYALYNGLRRLRRLF